jgi:hypothetical protein
VICSPSSSHFAFELKAVCWDGEFSGDAITVESVVWYCGTVFTFLLRLQGILGEQRVRTVLSKAELQIVQPPSGARIRLDELLLCCWLLCTSCGKLPATSKNVCLENVEPSLLFPTCACPQGPLSIGSFRANHCCWGTWRALTTRYGSTGRPLFASQGISLNAYSLNSLHKQCNAFRSMYSPNS